MWVALTHRVAIPLEISARVEALHGQWHLLVLSEDWCGDSINIVPIVAKLTESVSNMDMRILERDQKDRKSTRLNSSHLVISYAVFCLKKKNTIIASMPRRTGSRYAHITRWIIAVKALGKPSPPSATSNMTAVRSCDQVYWAQDACTAD